jgi:hypothetical protein
MPLYEYQGQQYDIATNDPVLAKQKILAHLGKSQETAAPKAAVPAPTPKDPEIPVAAYSTKEVIPGQTTTSQDLIKLGKSLVAEGLSAANLVASAPEFVAGVVQQGVVEPVRQMATTGKVAVDWGKAREDASRVVSPLGAPARTIEPLAKFLGLEEEYVNSGVNRTLGNLTEGMSWVATETEKKTGIPKEGTMAVLETLMVTGAPGVRPVARVAKESIGKATADVQVGTKMTADPVFKKAAEGVQQFKKAVAAEPVTAKDIALKIVEDTSHQEIIDTLNTPKTPTNAGEFWDSLYTLADQKKADQTVVANLETRLDELGVTPDLKEKFRRYTEETAIGNELINDKLDALKRQQQVLHETNAEIYNEGNLRSVMNPEGTVLWKDLPRRSEVLENRKAIEDLEKQMEELRAQYKNKEFLDPWEQKIYNETVGPQLKTITDLNKYLQKEQIVPEINMDPAVVGGYAPRYGMPDKGNAWENFKRKISGDQFGLQQDFTSGVLPPAAKERAVFVHELPNGVRKVISFSGNEVMQWKDGTSSRYLTKPADDLKAGDKLGKGTIKEATLDEIEKNTPYKYSRNLTAVSGTRLTELRDVARVNEFLKQWMESPHFNEVAHKITKGVEAPKGFVRPEHLDKMPQLNDYVFEPRVSEALEDFNRRWEPTALTEASNAVIKNMMINPLPHIHNEAVHWYLSRGASGIMNPKNIVSFGETLPKAFMEVYNKGPLYKEIMREGGSIMSANVRNNLLMEKAFEKGLKELQKDPSFVGMAKALGRSPLDLYDGISKASNKAMWSFRDVMYTQLIMEKMNKGASLKEAIKTVERHMPNYRLPTRVGEKVLGAKLSRVTSKVLQNPNWVVFARYKHGMVSSFLNGMKDLAMLDPNVKKSKQFKEGLDYAIALATLLGVVYPVMDSIFQAITDEDSAKVRRAGVTHLFSAIKDISESKKDAFALFSALITFNPIAQSMAELAFDYELYNRRNIYNIEDDWDIIATDAGNYVLRKVPQISEGMRASSEFGGGWKQWMLKQFDIKTQTADQIEREQDQIERRQTAAENRRDER